MRLFELNLQLWAFFILVKLCRRAPSRGANGCRMTAAMVLEVDPNEATEAKTNKQSEHVGSDFDLGSCFC